MKDLWNKTKPGSGALIFLVLTAVLAGLLVAEVARGELSIFGNKPSADVGGKLDTRPH